MKKGRLNRKKENITVKNSGFDTVEFLGAMGLFIVMVISIFIYFNRKNK